MSEPVRFARDCRSRLGWRGLARHSVRALKGGLAAACVLVLMERLLAAGLGAFWAVALPLAAAACVGVARGLIAWPSTLEAAVAADARLGLQERLSSALTPGDGPMADLVRADAERRIETESARRCFPFRVPRLGRGLAFLALALAICLLAPQADLLGWGAARARGAEEARSVRTAVEGAREEFRRLGQRAEGGAQDGTARMLSDYEQRLLSMLEADRQTVRRAAREAATELETRAVSGQRDRESRDLLVKAAEALGRCAAQLARDARNGQDAPKKGGPTQWAGNPLVRAPAADATVTAAQEPGQRWLDACETAASAMAGDAVPRRYRDAVQRYFAPDEPVGEPQGR